MTMTACYFCGSTQYKKISHHVFRGDTFCLAQCLLCNLVYTIPRVSAQESVRYYTDYYGERKPLVDGFLNRIRVRRVRRIIRLGSILDVGCGTGSFLLRMRHLGWESTGTEISPAYMYEDLIRQGVNIKKCDLPVCDLVPDSFDVVTLWHVFEHLMDPKAYLKKIHEILHDEGTLLIEVPNYASLQASVGGLAWFHLDIPRHTMHLTPKTLVQFLTSAGFHVEHVRSGSMFYDIFGEVQTMYNRCLGNQQVLFDIIGGRAHIRGHEKDIFLMAVLAPLVGLSALFAYALAALWGRSGTILVYAKKATI
ncbi:MAG: hypothetical protein A3C84_03880 [Candidatus Ryanbacteria bacterium RIFCSPHIGHO2_02_FULL_48_12]|uniref:Methyltransferase type 11 n=1 Tax=Candidatus Ryanbacteria bacterium RIFCSPHIGHO2_01_FULL_48_27 TaxID=1802115 RepID=A0A1G2G5E2_9BACT|nr:MAG: hypothetical protein A2756_00495 [Candidatus Ryanbacteria bacterium RIFCSPHIGHO2_01_FULL_48_27]OGZ48918.1 MAG: hypothetical protein A3C84_03880 [Candidatus Ryanbacteria bacterium RIFCSPHIGHO2_02_FULL_48_12]